MNATTHQSIIYGNYAFSRIAKGEMTLRIPCAIIEEEEDKTGRVVMGASSYEYLDEDLTPTTSDKGLLYLSQSGYTTWRHYIHPLFEKARKDGLIDKTWTDFELFVHSHYNRVTWQRQQKLRRLVDLAVNTERKQLEAAPAKPERTMLAEVIRSRTKKELSCYKMGENYKIYIDQNLVYTHADLQFVEAAIKGYEVIHDAKCRYVNFPDKPNHLSIRPLIARSDVIRLGNLYCYHVLSFTHDTPVVNAKGIWSTYSEMVLRSLEFEAKIEESECVAFRHLIAAELGNRRMDTLYNKMNDVFTLFCSIEKTIFQSWMAEWPMARPETELFLLQR